MKDLKMMFDTALEMVGECGIEYGNITSVTINYRAKSRFAQCKYNRAMNTYSINVNHLILDDNADEDKIMSTLIHEILHTCKGCMNHGKQWKQYGQIVKNNFGYDIARTSSYSDFGITNPYDNDERAKRKNNYVFRCVGCGQTIKKERMSKFVQYYKNYTCGICGCDFEFDSVNSNKQILGLKPNTVYIENNQG